MHDTGGREDETQRQMLQTDPSSGTYNLDQQEVRGGEELEKIAVSRKPFRELSCNSNVRTNLVPEDDRKIMKRIVCLKLKDDTHNPGKMNGQIMALKEHVKARYRLSGLIRAQKNDKMTSNLSKWYKETTQEMERTVHDNGSAPARTVLPLEYGACSAL